MKKILLAVLFSIVLVGIGGLIGYALGFNYEQEVLNKKLAVIRPLRSNDSSYKFINPLLLYIIPSSDQQAGLVSLKNKLSALISQNKKDGLEDASIYFSDLNHGRWIGINQNDAYNPASMLKVAIMVAYLKDSENNPKTLNLMLTYTKSIDDFVRQDQSDTLSELKIGGSYQTGDLINKMIINSDNGAAYLLLNNINQSSIDSIFTALNLQNPNVIGNSYTISPREYSFFFRILYSATYLSETDSEKALKILSGATFKEGLKGSIPDTVLAAHKFGERVISPQEVELHDCGIIYYPKNPYLLCVMTKGSSLDTLKNTIKGISQIVYQNYASTQ